MERRTYRFAPALLVCASLVAATLVIGPVSASPIGPAEAAAGPGGSGASFAPGVIVHMGVEAVDGHGRLAGARGRVGQGAVGAVLDPATGVVTEIGTIGYSSSAVAITDGGLVAGWSNATLTGPEHAVVFDLETGTLTDLGTLGGSRAEATGINDAGLVVGTTGAGAASRGFIHDLATSTTTLLAVGALPLDISEDSRVLLGGPGGHRVLDLATGTQIDLSTRIAGLMTATAISDNGLVAGTRRIGGRDEVFVNDLDSQETWTVWDEELVFSWATVSHVTPGGAVSGSLLGLDYLNGFVAVPEIAMFVLVPPLPGGNYSYNVILGDGGDVAATNCFWEPIAESPVCGATYRTRVQLVPSPPRAVTSSSCVRPAVFSWEPPHFDGFTTLIGFEVRRDGQLLATLPPSATTFTDPVARNHARYEVHARNAEGSSPPGMAYWPPAECVGGAISGRVTADGEPLAGISVRLLRASDGALVRKATTGPAGTYRLTTLPRGPLVLRFNDPSGTHPLEWYDDAPTRQAARLIEVDRTVELVADAELALAGRIQGVVRGPAGPIPGIVARLYDADTLTLLTSRTTQSDGSYSFEGVWPGRLKLRFHDPSGVYETRWWGGGTTLATAYTFEIWPEEVLPIDQFLNPRSP